MIRELAKTGVATGMHILGIDRLVGVSRGLAKLPLVLSYHRVVRDFDKSVSHSIPPMLVSASTFERHLDWIGQHYSLVSLDELAVMLDQPNSARKPIAAITFDDGYQDVYRNAFPILVRKGIPAAVFVVTDLVGTDRLQFHDELYLLLSGALSQWVAPERRLDQVFTGLQIPAAVRRQLVDVIHDPFQATRVCLASLSQARVGEINDELRKEVHVPASVADDFRALNWEMLSEMITNGITVGSHTKSHALLANENRIKVLDELRGSRELLENRLNIKVRHFAYPDGRFNAANIEAVEAAGFQYAYTTCMHQDKTHSRLTIPRRVLWENSCLNSFGGFSPSILSCQVNGIFDPARKCQQDHGFSTA